MPDAAPTPFVLRDPSIELARLLKAVGACDSGGAAKHAVQAGLVTVNGAKELRRGRTLRPGDVVGHAGRRYEVRPASGAPPSG